MSLIKERLKKPKYSRAFLPWYRHTQLPAEHVENRESVCKSKHLSPKAPQMQSARAYTSCKNIQLITSNIYVGIPMGDCRAG